MTVLGHPFWLQSVSPQPPVSQAFLCVRQGHSDSRALYWHLESQGGITAWSCNAEHNRTFSSYWGQKTHQISQYPANLDTGQATQTAWARLHWAQLSTCLVTLCKNWKGNSLPQTDVKLTGGHVADWHHSLCRRCQDGVGYLYKWDYILLLSWWGSGLDPRNPICLIYHYYIKRTPWSAEPICHLQLSSAFQIINLSTLKKAMWILSSVYI